MIRFDPGRAGGAVTVRSVYAGGIGGTRVAATTAWARPALPASAASSAAVLPPRTQRPGERRWARLLDRLLGAMPDEADLGTAVPNLGGWRL